MKKLPKAKKINSERYIAGLSFFKKKAVKIKLSANESALGPSPKAIKAYNSISTNFVRYPDSDGINLRKKLAKKFKINIEQIILGSGSDQILELVCKAFLNKNDEVVVSQNSFIVYRIYSKINGAKIKFAKEKKLHFSINNVLSCITNKTKIVFIANPNNPTGTYINRFDLINLRKKIRSNILLVVDDAYYEYVKDKNYSSGLKLFSKSRNVLVTRTFSKLYGLAGLRVGWGYSSKDIIKSLNQIKPPFNINTPGLSAAEAAVSDSIWTIKEINHVNKWRKKMFSEFKRMKIQTNLGQANFLLINFDRVKFSSIKVFQELAKRGILVRKMDAYGIKNSLRITIGTVKENKELLYKIGKILNV